MFRRPGVQERPCHHDCARDDPIPCDCAHRPGSGLHGAGTNRSANIRRMANLLQVSSAFGRAMETVDSMAICRAVFPVLKARGAGAWGGAYSQAARNLITVAAEGYPFPTDLDRDQPIGGMTPQTQAELLSQAVAEDWEPGRLDAELAAQQQRRMAGAA